MLPRLDIGGHMQEFAPAFGLLLRHHGGGVGRQRCAGENAGGLALLQRRGAALARLRAADHGKFFQTAFVITHGITIHGAIVKHRAGVLRGQRRGQNAVGRFGQR